MKLRTKLIIAFVLLSTTSITLSGRLAYRLGRDALERATFERLTGLRQSKKRQIEDYFTQLHNLVATIGRAPATASALDDFRDAFVSWPKDAAISPTKMDEYRKAVRDYYETVFIPRLAGDMDAVTHLDQYVPGSNNVILLQNYYIANNDNETGRKDRLVSATGAGRYGDAHANYHPLFRRLLNTFSFYDIFLIDAETGHIVYTVFKEVDVGTSLIDGPYWSTNLARAFRRALHAEPGQVVLEDFERYVPSYGAPAAFLATPIHRDGLIVGVLAFQAPIDRINDIMTSSRNWADDGLGESGETYLVGADFLMRNDSRFIIQHPERFIARLAANGTEKERIEQIRKHNTTILFQQVRTDASRAALEGKTDTRIVDDYRGIPVLSAFTPVNIPDVHWALLSEIDVDEAFAPAARLHTRILTLAIVIALAVALLAVVFAGTLTRPLMTLARGVREVGKGDLSRRIDVRSRDEIGLVASAFNQMASNLERTTVSRDYFDRVFTSMINSVIVVEPDADGKVGIRTPIAMANRATGELLKRAHDDIIGTPIGDVFVDNEGPHHWLDTVIRNGVLAGVELTCSAYDGRQIPILFSSSVLRDARNRFRGIVCVAQDITERKRAEQAVRDRQRIERDLEIAASIQKGLLPEDPPEADGYDIAGWSRPADQAGGDYFDWQKLSDGRIAISIADVTGHGIGPALVTAVCRAYARASFSSGEELGTLMSRINDLLIQDLPPERFVTFVVALLDAHKGEVALLSAGHGPLLFYSKSRDEIDSFDAHDLPFGIMPGIAYGPGNTLHFEPGDVLMLITDGYFEWRNGAGEQFGLDRLNTAFRDACEKPAADIITHVHDAVMAFVGNSPQDDDITAVIIKRKA